MPLKRRIVLDDAEINSPPEPEPEPVQESKEIHLRPGIGSPPVNLPYSPGGFRSSLTTTNVAASWGFQAATTAAQPKIWIFPNDVSLTVRPDGAQTATAVKQQHEENALKIMKLLDAGMISVNEARKAFGLGELLDKSKLAEGLKKHDPAAMQFGDFNEFIDEIKKK